MRLHELEARHALVLLSLLSHPHVHLYRLHQPHLRDQPEKPINQQSNDSRYKLHSPNHDLLLLFLLPSHLSSLRTLLQNHPLLPYQNYPSA